MAKTHESPHAIAKSLQSVTLSFFTFSNVRSPYMMPNSEPEPYVTGEHIILGSGKFVLLDKLLPKLFMEGHRVLLFSGFTSYVSPFNCMLMRMLDICEDYFTYRGWKYARLDGGTTRPKRALDIRLFNQKNSRIFTHNCF
jgi:SWI/SNF-related matrix-associated actin-dependent regulator of chromatin subfamily A member 5